MTSRARLEKIGIAVPEILLPRKGTPKERWSVIACDQFSSERSYWEHTKQVVDNSPSTLNLIIPECYLDDGDREARADAANAAMADYLEREILEPLAPGFILVDRSTPHADSRKGLVLAVDLESYDYAEKSTSRIRPTEGTIRDRLPPRMAVRRGALLDLPHILLLIDDPENLVMNAAAAVAGEVVYDFDLMQGGGHISGRFIGVDSLETVAAAFEKLAGRSNLLFAVGDGNHSLATAREIWKEKKAEGASMNHPSRYALVEVENIHDPGLHFHPIHRVLFDVDETQLLSHLKSTLGAREVPVPDTASGPSVSGIQVISSSASTAFFRFPVPAGRLEVEPVQDALDSFLHEHPDADIDYIHGEDSVKELLESGARRFGIILPNLDKSLFFRRIITVGPYPRKTFSIGEAREKRYYLESRRI